MRRSLPNKRKDPVWTSLEPGAGRVVRPPFADFKASGDSHRQRERNVENSQRNVLFSERLPKRREVAPMISSQPHCFRYPAPLAVHSVFRRLKTRHKRRPDGPAADVRRRLYPQPSTLFQQPAEPRQLALLDELSDECALSSIDTDCQNI